MLRDILSRGYFPFEVPEVFYTSGFAAAAMRGSRPQQFTPPTRGGVAMMARHNLARKKKLRRVLGIPNPIAFFNLASEVAQHWPTLEAQMARSSVSASSIIPDPLGERAIVPQYGPTDLPRLRAKTRRTHRFVLFADVQQFYPSLYTHSIAWAVEGKAAAKADRSRNLLGNRLDYWVNRAQDGQTGGVPIGPDTSRVMAELVLSAVDEHLQNRLGSPIKGFRAVDDYELSFSSRAEAERALAELQSSLAEFELRLNDDKTDILELPLPLDGQWTADLRNFAFPTAGTRARIRAVTEYFSLAFQLARGNPEHSVLRYAIARAAQQDWSGPLWNVYQDLLLLSATAEPGTLQRVTSELRKYQRQGASLDVHSIEMLILRTVEEHVPRGHGSEVLWALWMAMVLRLQVPGSVSSLLPSFEDPLVPILALLARAQGLITTLDTTEWEQHMTRDGLYSSQWLLAYEAGVRNWLPSRGRRNHIDADPNFRYLKQQNVRFLKTRTPTSPRVTRWRSRMSLVATIGYGI